MRKILLAPDSFKGTISSLEICDIMEQAIRSHLPQAEVISIPVADGGEGSVDCFLAAVGGEKVWMSAKGPYFEERNSYYGLLPDGTAVIEMAACAGLPLVGDNKSAEKTTTYGVGMQIAHALESGCKKIVVGLGGSATNDGGTGAAAALGVLFYDETGESFVPTGATLQRIARIDKSQISPKLRAVEIVSMCDIDNPLCGENGAAHVFGPQKGANPEMVRQLDAGLRHMANIVQRDLSVDILNLSGAGAAGGMGGGMVAFLGSNLQMGIETVLDATGFDRHLSDADLIFTGEGKIDSQSLRGKVVIGVASRAKKHVVPVIAVVGSVGDGAQRAYEMGVSAIFSINQRAEDFSVSRYKAKENLRDTMDNILRFYQCTQ